MAEETKSDLWPIFVNKVFLARSHAHLLSIVYGYCCAAMAAAQHGRDYMTHKSSNVYYLALHQKCPSNPHLRKSF